MKLVLPILVKFLNISTFVCPICVHCVGRGGPLLPQLPVGLADLPMTPALEPKLHKKVSKRWRERGRERWREREVERGGERGRERCYYYSKIYAKY